MSNKTIVFFDLDGTITQRDTYKEILVYGLIKRPLRAPLIALSVYDFILHKAGKRTNTYVKQRLLHRIFGDVSLDKIKDMSQDYARFVLKYGVKKQALETLKEYTDQGVRVVLISASFDFYVNEIAKLLNIKEVISTKAQVENNQLTGFLEGENCHSEQKIVRIEEKINLADYSEIIAYSDHHSDLPLLNIATTSYAVCPTAKLKLHMEKVGGNILLWS